MLGIRLIAALCFVAAAFSASIPARANWELPPQWTEQERVWVAWVPSTDTEHQTPSQTAAQLLARATIVAQLTDTIDVTIIVPSDARSEAESAIANAGADVSRVDYFIHEVIEYFVRDPGPLFLTNGEDLMVRQLGWDCFAYTYPVRDPGCQERGNLGSVVAASRDLPVELSEVRSEGGALEVSEDLLIAFRDAHERRNPDMTVEEIEEALLAAYGKEKIIWLNRTPYSDYGGQKVGNFYGWGANGHTDEFVRFVSNNTVLVAQVPDGHTDNILTRTERAILQDIRAQLEKATGVDGEPLRIIDMPHPDLALFAQRWPTGEWMDETFPTMFRNHREEDFVNWVPMASYMNFFITNAQVLVAAYWSEGLPESVREDDLRAQEILQAAFPGREIVGIDVLALNWLGGGIHCLTQQQPRISTTS